MDELFPVIILGSFFGTAMALSACWALFQMDRLEMNGEKIPKWTFIAFLAPLLFAGLLMIIAFADH